MRLPVDKAIITSPYGYRVDPITLQPGQLHDGIDFKSPDNNNVYAVTDCVVSYDKDNYKEALRWSDPKESGGNCVIVDFQFNYTLFHMRYWHLIENFVSANQQLKEGDLIGKYGDVGRSKGAHCHNDLYIQSVGDKWEKVSIEEFYKFWRML